MEINGYTRLAAVVAKPIKHSLSPLIHNLAFEQIGENGAYLAFEVSEADLKSVIDMIIPLDMYGMNLSMPYKEAAVAYMADLSEVAKLTGAINTIVNRNGRLFGTSTDGAGFFKSLPQFTVAGSEITVIGAGGAARAIIAEAALQGASRITVYNRTYRPELFAHYPGDIQFKPLTALKAVTGDLLVNTTSVGMGDQQLPIAADLKLPPDMLVADIIYQPLETPFLKFARSQGNQTVNGLGMLVYQAAESFKLWTGQEMPVDMILSKLAEKVEG
ncbi:MAG: shikimate dehydrogenase [Streptococcaceae bacterium]|jgi:shikimate dehydrogenase|nr:shikimate dehydrogenase [Streptococcaceae bacterium]